MAATPALYPSSPVASLSRVKDWAQQLSGLASAHADALSLPFIAERDPLLNRKRKRSAPCPHRMSPPSPKRPRRDTDLEILPSHSVSAIEMASGVLDLNKGNTFSLPASQVTGQTPRRSNSPTRDNVVILASAVPPTITMASSGLEVPPPRKVTNVMDRLEEGLGQGWIPGRLRELIEGDQDLGFQRIERHAWSEGTIQNLSDLRIDDDEYIRLTYILRKVKQIWSNARLCQLRGRDGNAWCMDVLQPLVKLAIRLEGKEKFWLQSVQSQTVATEFLSSVPAVPGLPGASAKLCILDRKADFTLSFSHKPSPGFGDVYSRLRTANNHVISHMVDAFTRTTALFSCIEVKPADGDLTEAEYQLSMWIAASLRKKMQLARHVGLVDKSGLVEPCFVIVGHRMYVYLAYVSSEQRNEVQILGPESGLLGAGDTGSVSGIFRALKLWQNAITYGRDKGNEGFWGGFMGLVLQKLAGEDH